MGCCSFFDRKMVFFGTCVMSGREWVSQWYNVCDVCCQCACIRVRDRRNNKSTTYTELAK